ncbi:MAG: hypothetical protein ACRDL2_08945 [Gaiellaceae bacterium]
MKNFQTLKLTASPLGSAAKRGVDPAQDVQAAPPRAPRAAAPGLKKRLVALFAVELAATLAAVAAQGSVHSMIFRIAAAGLALTVALVVAIESVASMRRPSTAAAAAPAAAPRPASAKKPFNKTRVALLFMMALGFATYFGGGGTFSSFSASTSNSNSSIASGSLLMQNTIGSLCESKSGASNDNVNFGCNSAFTFTNQQAGVYSGTASVSIKDSGTLDAAKLYLSAPYANGVLSGSTLSGGNVASLTLSTSGGPNGLEGTVNNGDTIVVTYGALSQSFVANGAAAPGATTINVNATQVPTGAVTAGATVEDTSSDTGAANTNCYDTQVTNLGFNPTTGNPLCSATILFVQETTGGKYWCWWGSGAGAVSPNNGQCDAPISVSPTGLGTSANQTIAAGTYAVGALNGNIKSGDTIRFSEAGNKLDCTATGDKYFAATSIVLTGACTVISGANGVFDNNAIVTDTSSLGRNASDATHSISKFDQNAKGTSHIELTPITGTAPSFSAPVAAVDLASSATRTFVVGVVIPGPATPQNQLQALKSTFGISWQLTQ